MDMGSNNKDTGMFCFTGMNSWPIWKEKMEDILYCMDLYQPILKDSDLKDKLDPEQWRVMNRKTCGMIRKWLDVSICPHVSGITSAFEMWQKLHERYERKTVGNKTLLIRKLVNLKYRDGSSMAEHLNAFQSIVNQLAVMKTTFEEEVQASLLLSSLPSSWDTLVVSISNSTPEGSLTVPVVHSVLLNEESRRAANGEEHPQALVNEDRGRSNSRKPHGRGKSKARSKSKGKPKYQCWYCKQDGHMKKNCYEFKKDLKEGKVKQKDEGTSAAITSDDGIVVFVDEGECLHTSGNKVEWVVDTAASYHVTPRKDFFTNYRTGDYGNVRMGNSSVAKILGIGDICTKTDVGCTLVLKDVRHVPDLRLNLISGLALDKEGYVSMFGQGAWKLSKGSMTVARGKACCTLYKTYLDIVAQDASVNALEATSELWHQRLGHMSEKGMKLLSQKNFIPSNAGSMAFGSCEACLAGKQHRVSFTKHSERKKELLELVHTDVCGPLDVPTLGGRRYFLTFIDDSSRKVWVYILLNKFNVFEAFSKFHMKVERETGKKLKCLRSDNGGEYVSHEFESYCSQHGIRHEKTVPGTPQHNGLAERMNRTLMDKARAMLFRSKLPKTFWGEAVLTASYIVNRSPSVALKGDVPESVWLKKEVSYAHLRVFGCKAYVHVPKENRSKLDDRGTPCVFVGYGDEEFGYRLYDPKAKKIVRSRDVVFFEDETIADIQVNMKPNASRSLQDDNIPISSPWLPEGREGEAHEEPVVEDPVGGDETLVRDESTGQDAELPPPEVPQLRRSTREPIPSRKYNSEEYTLLTEEGEPEDFEEALCTKEKMKWLKAMEEEMDSLKKNDTYEIVEAPRGKRVLHNKWVFKLKRDSTGKVAKYKARLVVKGFEQKEGIDFTEIFSPVVKMTSIRVVLAMAAWMDLEIEQLDVKTAFLHGELEEEIYMKQPEGFEVKGKEHMVCRLKKSLYGLKQAPRQWYKRFDSFMASQGYTRTAADHCVYRKSFTGGRFIVLLLYVDDMLIVGQDGGLIKALKRDLFKAFDMKDLGSAQHILGMKIERDRKSQRLWLSQSTYVEKILERFGMKNAKPVSTPLAGHFKLCSSMSPDSEEGRKEMASIPYASAVGSLMYAMVCTRPDIAHAMGVVSKYMANPGREHWEAVKWILRYLRGTSDLRLCFGSDNPILQGYTDADMAGDLDRKRSTSGYVFTLSGGAVSWQSKLQKCVALSTTEAEYIAMNEAGKELLWLKRFLLELGIKQETFVLHCDAQSAIDLCKNPTYHPKTKHIAIRYHWIREVLEEGEMIVKKIDTSKNPADMTTKMVTREKHELCSKLVGMT